MKRSLFIFGLFCVALLALIGLFSSPFVDNYLPGKADIREIRARVTPTLQTELSGKGFTLGDPVFMRLFKETKTLEVWIKHGDVFELFKSYPVCTFSGSLGPKRKEGDRQSPEGFYSVAALQLNPNSNYHLAFNVGFPNEYDRMKGYTGSFLMVHGSCVSIGCYAMGNSQIEEIYLLTEAALQNGQEQVALHLFPFKMTKENMEKHQLSEWLGFWKELQSGYDAFEKNHLVPDVTVKNGKYWIDTATNP